MNKALMDTDILSEIVRGRDRNLLFRERDYLVEWGSLTISAVTLMEVVRGLWLLNDAKLQARFATKVLSQEILAFTGSTGELAGKIIAQLADIGQPIGLPDCMIAATAIEHGLELVTGNTRHFERIRELGFPLLLANWRDAGG
jgi:tRNA(fMet)-specific endonuclease VapC